jgi:hypothetical protein
LGFKKYDSYQVQLFWLFWFAFYDFWVPEMVYKYVSESMDETRYFHGEKFESPVRTAFTVCHLSIVLHLLHGFSSSFSQLVSIINIQKHYKISDIFISFVSGSFLLHYFIISIINIQL